MNPFWRSKAHNPGQSLRWAMSLPRGPLTQHLASLHAILVHEGASEEALRLAEHHLREIGVATAEPGRPGLGNVNNDAGTVKPKAAFGWTPAKHEQYAEKVQPYIEDQIKKNNDAIEAMCERMLTQDGTDYGVLVKDMNNGTVEVSLSPEVPFGQIHHTREGASE